MDKSQINSNDGPNNEKKPKKDILNGLKDGLAKKLRKDQARDSVHKDNLRVSNDGVIQTSPGRDDNSYE